MEYSGLVMAKDHQAPGRSEHAAGAAGAEAHGFFELYESLDNYTRAGFLTDAGAKTPVSVCFSSVCGSRGSTEPVREISGFATRFYTEEGNYDLVCNNIPVFFIQDAGNFPDPVQSIRPEHESDHSRAVAAHDSFWSFVSLTPESMHMIMWIMSDRSIPRSFRMMEGFGVNTFRLINRNGQSHFVKFHWKPLLGVHSMGWDEVRKISGTDPDYHRKDLWQAIEEGTFPEWELGLQIIPEKDEHKYPFDLLDPTKLIPEELVPVRRVGKMTLTRNPDKFSAGTGRTAFHPGHVVPGIDFTNDPLLQGRLFSCSDTQLLRLGRPRFHKISANRSAASVQDNRQDGHRRQSGNSSGTSSNRYAVSGGSPFQADTSGRKYERYNERVGGKKIRGRSRSFFDHFSQASLFYSSQSKAEKKHLADAFVFELEKVRRSKIRIRMLELLSQVDLSLSAIVADGLGLPAPKETHYPASNNPAAYDAAQQVAASRFRNRKIHESGPA